MSDYIKVELTEEQYDKISRIGITKLEVASIGCKMTIGGGSSDFEMTLMDKDRFNQPSSDSESLDMIDTTSKQVESLAKGDVVKWKNGDECVIKNPEGFGVWEEANKYLGTAGTVMAVFTNTNGLEVAAVSHEDEICICWMLSMLEKPESTEQKAERERDEKAKQIMIDICGDEVFKSRDWDYHKIFSHNAKMAFQLVDLGYRKEK
ncbi:hypothetical protein [Vibrio phage XM1]|nr:hypothetical protein [Vibrio phage XM1]